MKKLKKAYKLILASCTQDQMKRIHEYIEQDKLVILSGKKLSRKCDKGEKDEYVKGYVDLYRQKVSLISELAYDEDSDLYVKIHSLSVLYNADEILINTMKSKSKHKKNK